MPITEATIRQAKYFPELLPDARVVPIGAGSEVSPPLLDLRRFSPKVLRLVHVTAYPNAYVFVRVRADDLRHEANSASLAPLADSFDFLTTEYLSYTFYNASTSPISDYTTTFSMWVYEPTVAHKLRYRKMLTPEEKEIATRLGIDNSVDKGVLPLPLSYMLEREYYTLAEETYAYVMNIGGAGNAPLDTDLVIGDVVPRNADEFLVLTSIVSSPGTVSNNITIRIDRDNDANYIEFPAYALSLPAGLTVDIGRELKCWVPALKEIRVKVYASSAGGNITGYQLRFTVRRCALTNLLRVRFGLASRSDVSGDLWDKVKGGVL